MFIVANDQMLKNNLTILITLTGMLCSPLRNSQPVWPNCAILESSLQQILFLNKL